MPRGIISSVWQLPYLPFLRSLDQVPPLIIQLPLAAILYLAPLAILLNFYRKTFALLLGGAILLEVLACKPFYSTSQLFLASLFILIGLYREERRIFRWQLGLLYGGAALNKALLPDWWNGQYFRGFAELYSGPWWPLIADSSLWCIGLGVLTILIEGTLALLFQFPRYTKTAIILGISFHGGLLLFTLGGLSWFYFYLLLVAYSLLQEWPATRQKRRRWVMYTSFVTLILLFQGRFILLKILAAAAGAIFGN
ncbi:MAG: hypothetical protein AAGA62_05760 [Bacteroidota bacterium]